ncbi:glycosyltransferase [Kitasatospora sp. NPDC050463]|uniref:glycosyltransferase n=1 Tax=Kitasatospora sp. NPDC050463 TaxID=3155786 RepID=UPI0033CDDB2D
MFPLAALPAAVVLWLLSLGHVALDEMGDLGLVEVLPVTFWVAVVVLTVGFCVALRDRRTPGWLYAGYLLALIGVMHASAPLMYSQLSNAWAWKHVAMVDVLLRAGTLPVAHDHGLDVYTEWPGFFSLNAVVVRATGLPSALSYAPWAPPVADALLLAPLVMLYRSFSRSRRLTWAAAWVFYCCYWVTQDYFSAQTFTFLLYLAVIATVVRCLPRPLGLPGDGDTRGAHPLTASGPRGRRRPAVGDHRTRWTLLFLLLPVAAIVCAHPLTPLMLICSLALLAVPRRNRRVVLPILLATIALTAAWDLTVARPFLSQNLRQLAEGLTQPGGNASSALIDLSVASPGQVLVAWTDRVLSALVWLLAALAVVRRPALRRGALPLLAVAPLPMLAGNSYDGEMLFRAYMFALPATAFAMTALLFRPASRSRLRAAALPALLLVLFAGFALSYLGKEYALYFTRDEVRAARWLFEHAPPGSVITGVTEDFPAGYTDYDRYQRLWINMQGASARETFASHPAQTLNRLLPPGQAPAFLMLNKAQEGRLRATGWLPSGPETLRANLDGDPRFRAVYRNPDAVVYEYSRPPAGGTP